MTFLRAALLIVAVVIALMTTFLIWNLFQTTRFPEGTLPLLRVPLLLGNSVDDATAPEGADFAPSVDEPDPRDSGSGELRMLTFQENQVDGPVTVSYGYRKSDRRVWRQSVAGMAGRYRGDLGLIRFGAKIDEILRTLGAASRVNVEDSSTRTYWFFRDDLSHRIRVFMGNERNGELAEIEWYSRTLGPPGYGESSIQ